METEPRMTTKEQFKKQEDVFRRNAFLLISEMVKMSPEHPSVLVDEILHSIFFLGKIKHKPSFAPEDIVNDDEMLTVLKDCYPQPFELYSSQVPKRGPISCVLDMIVHLMGQENENEIIKRMHELTLQLQLENPNKYLFSSAICVSQKQKDDPYSNRYYGVSMSTSGKGQRKIMIAASCLSAWHSYVAGAVMTYYPENEKKTKKPYFDGTIKLPEQVRCQAFSLSDQGEKPPCQSCGNLFGLTTSSEDTYPYGNCAEAESLSNLFKGDKEKSRKRAERTVSKELRSFLSNLKWNEDVIRFYPTNV